MSYANARLLFALLLMGTISGLESLEYNYTPAYANPSWDNYIDFFGGKIINPTQTLESVRSIYDAPLIGDEFVRNKTLEAKAYAEEAVFAEEVCSYYFVFDENGNIELGQILLGSVGGSLSRLSESELESVMAYNDVIGPAFGKVVEEYTEAKTKKKKVGNETKTVTYYVTKYRLIPYEGSDTIGAEDAERLIEASVKIVELDAGFAFTIATLLRNVEVTATNFYNYASKCVEYGIPYVDAWNAMEEVASYEVGKVNDNINRLNAMLEDLDYKGLCNENYTGPGSEACNALREEVGSLASSGKELSTIREALANLSTDTPFFSEVRAIVEAEESLTNRTRQLESLYNASLKELNESIEQAKLDMGQEVKGMKVLLESAEQEKVYLIRGAVLSGTLSEGARTLEGDYEKLKADISYIESNLETLEDLESLKPKDYLRREYEIVKEMERRALASEDLVEKAKEFLDALDQRVESRIAELKASGYVVGSLEDNLRKARAAGKLGERYLLYVKVLDEAEDLESKGPEKEEEYKELSAYLADLLDRAERDGLSTSYEEERFRATSEMEASYVEKVSYLERIKEDVLQKARARFSSLNELKEELESLLAVGEFPSMEREKERKEALVFYGGVIDWEKALGNLLELERFYEESITTIREDVEAKAQLLKLEVSTNTPAVSIDEEGELNIELFIYNRFPYNLQEVEKEVSVEGEFYTDEISVDRGYVISQGERITWYVPFLNAFESLSGKITKRGVFIRSISKKEGMSYEGENAVKFTNYSVMVEVPSILEVDCDCEVSVDGIERGAINTIELSSGEHEISFKESTKPYELKTETLGCSSAGSETLCRKKMVVEAMEDLEIARIALPEGSAVEELPESAEVVGKYVLLKGLSEGSAYNITFIESRQDEDSRLSEILDYIYEGNVTESLEEEISQIRSLNISGFKTQALERAEELYERVKEEREGLEEQARLASEVSEEIAKDVNELEAAIEVGSSLSPELEDKLDEIKESNTSNYDKRWKRTYLSNTAKALWTRFSSLKRDYFKNGAPDREVDALLSSFEENHRKAKSLFSIEYLAKAAKALDDAEKEIEKRIGNKEDISKEFDALKIRLSNKLAAYKELEARAKKYGVEDFLPRTYGYFKSKMSSLSSAKDLRQKALAIGEMESLEAEIDGAINSTKESALKALESAEETLKARSIPESVWMGSMEKARASLESGDYAKALALAEEMKNNAYSYGIEGKEDLLPYLLLAGVAVAGIGVMYGGRLFKKEERPRRRIRKYGES